MHGFTSTLLFGILVTCGTLIGAEPATAPAQTQADKQLVLDDLDKLIVARLKPAEESKPIRIHGTLKLVPSESSMAKGRVVASTTQPYEIVLGVDDEDAQRLKQAEFERRRHDEAQRALADEERAMAEAQLAVRRAHEQADGTYLGIGVESPDDTLRAQLSLPPGAGLVINYVDENGPAKSAVQLHDVLQKLDDQLLINGEQLVALVRMHKPGDTVSLTLLRRAKPVTVEVELGKRKLSRNEVRLPADALVLQKLSGFSLKPAPDADKWTELRRLSLDWTGLPPQPIETREPRVTTFNDGELLVSLTARGELAAVNIKDGKVLYHGPVGTEQQWNALPAPVRDKLVSWRRLVQPSAATQATKPVP